MLNVSNQVQLFKNENSGYSFIYLINFDLYDI